MADFDTILEKAKSVAGMAVDASVELYKAAEVKARLLAKTTKLKTDIAVDKATVKRVYTKIGEMYYRSHHSVPTPEFESVFAQVRFLVNSIESKENQLRELWAEPDDYDDDECDCDECDDDVEDVDIEIEIVADDVSGEPIAKPVTGGGDVNG